MAPTNEKVSNHVPEDIIFFSIFSKLPLKSLNRFTCVRKSWTLLFENPIFINMFGKNMVSKHHSLYDETDLILNHFDSINRRWKLHLVSDEKFESKVQLNWPRPFTRNYSASNPHIVGSAINGILCIYDREDSSTIVLWNPVTGELTWVPQSRAGLYDDEFETEFVIHGFGYDHGTDDYKIIQRVVYFGVDGDWEAEPSGPLWGLYSLKNNSWKKINVDMPKRYLMSGAGVEVYLNGVCYWWGGTDDKTYVVSFNLSNETHLTTLFPFNLHDFQRVDRHLTVLNGHVAMILSNVKTTLPSFNISISVLGEPGVAESWTKFFELRPLSCIGNPIGSGKKGNVFFRKDDDELACLDLSTGVVEDIGVKAERYRAQVVVYKKNFLSVGGMTD